MNEKNDNDPEGITMDSNLMRTISIELGCGVYPREEGRRVDYDDSGY